MTQLYAQYDWLLHGDKPNVIKEALGLFGTYEWKGGDNNPVIIEWAKEIGNKVGMAYLEDATPWCGLFVGICVKRAGFELPSILVRATSWLKFGTHVEKAALGDVLVFKRTGGGHVGFYIGEDKFCYHVLGGNQSDMVNITRIEKERCIGIRRCKWKIKQPDSVRPIILASHGNISRNEA